MNPFAEIDVTPLYARDGMTSQGKSVRIADESAQTGWEEIGVVLVDDSAGEQQYIEDCHVCCSPINIDVSFDEDGGPLLVASGENEA